MGKWLFLGVFLDKISFPGQTVEFRLSGKHFSASYKASEFCWQSILEFPQHLRMTHKLQKHKMTHTDEKAHKCHQYLPCVHAPSFKIQMRTHMGEMSYKCSQCNYTCTQVTNLHRHMLTHTKVRAFNCDQSE